MIEEVLMGAVFAKNRSWFEIFVEVMDLLGFAALSDVWERHVRLCAWVPSQEQPSIYSLRGPLSLSYFAPITSLSCWLAGSSF